MNDITSSSVSAAGNNAKLRTNLFKNLLIATVSALMLLAGSSTSWAQASQPGAMKANGNFFVLKNTGAGLQIREWNNSGAGAWILRAQYPNATGQSLGGLTTSGAFHFTQTLGGNPVLSRWEPSSSPAYQGYPTGWPSLLSAPSAVMYGNRVMLIGDSKLHERFMFGNTTWYTHGMAPGNKPLRNVPPCVLSDGHVFVITAGGEVFQMWWNGANNTWNWLNHGYPKKFNFFGKGGVKANSVGAAMPASNKVFVTCADGSLRQIYYDSAHWIWFNHGNPFGYSVDSPAVAVSDGKLFVTGSSNNTRALFQLYWNGTIWVWYNHGTPPGTNIANGTGAAAALGGDNVAVQGANGNFYLLYWNGAIWAWKNIGS